ncbi:PmeII family type II restriction endonuclease [Aggregatilineales bacterium SYSU G02658]
MSEPLRASFQAYLSDHVVSSFYARRLKKLQDLSIEMLVSRKNPYLFRAKNLQIAGDLVKSAVDAFLSSQEETIFGSLMEGFAVFVAQEMYGGKKSSYPSVDLEFERLGNYFIVGIKSGIYWGNSDQINAMRRNFRTARYDLIERGIQLPIVAVNGCIYGRDANPLKSAATSDNVDDTYYRYAGQDFWYFLTGDDDFYQKIVEPIGEKAHERDRAFQTLYAAKVNEMTILFSRRFVTPSGDLDWHKLVAYVSGRP